MATEGIHKILNSQDRPWAFPRTKWSHLGLSSAYSGDTRDMTADGHTKGKIERDMLLQLMTGAQKYAYPVKEHTKANPRESQKTLPTSKETDAPT